MPHNDFRQRGLQSSSPTLRELAIVVFRQRRIFISVAGVVVVATLLYAVFGSQYQAHMKVLVGRGRVDAPMSAVQNAPVDLTRMVITEEELNSEVELLKDDEVLRKVVEGTDLANHDWLRFLRPNETTAEQVERTARRLAKKIQVEPVKKTNLINVSYGSSDPSRAAKVLQTLANVYREKHTEVYRPSGEFHFFEQQSGESRRQLEEAQQKLRQFTLSRGVVAAAQQRDLALQRLSDVDASYRQTQIALAETRSRVEELRAQLRTLPERATTQVRTADNPELLRALKSSLLDLELKRTDLLTKFEPSHPLAQEIERQIAQAKAAIAAESLMPLRDETTDKDANYEWAKAELQRAEVNLRGLEEKAAATGTQVSAYRALSRQLGDDTITQDDLLSSEKAAQESYLLYVKKREEARMNDALDERGIVNVTIADHPVSPALPVWSAWAILAVGFVAAGACGTGAAFAADYLDPAFRTPDEVLAYLQTPVLASLPAKGTSGRVFAWRSAS
jgi:uncharacterized protein involved in exopolysaccharide biosynthesis